MKSYAFSRYTQAGLDPVGRRAALSYAEALGEELATDRIYAIRRPGLDLRVIFHRGLEVGPSEAHSLIWIRHAVELQDCDSLSRWQRQRAMQAALRVVRHKQRGGY